MTSSHLAVRLVGNKLYVNNAVFCLDAATEDEKKLVHQFVDLWFDTHGQAGIKGRCHSQRANQRKIMEEKRLRDNKIQLLIQIKDQVKIMLSQDKFIPKAIGSS